MLGLAGPLPLDGTVAPPGLEASLFIGAPPIERDDFEMPQAEPAWVADGSEPHGAIHAALQWLAGHASADGMWTTERCRKCGPCPGEPAYDVGRTGLALLAFFGAGYTHRSSETVRRALQALCARQAADGAVGPPDAAKFLYNHLLATLAFCEGYRLTRSPLLEDPARRAVAFLLAAQNPGSGWRYTPESGDNDSIVTGWAVLALRSAQEAGIEVPSSAFAGASSWFERVTDENYGRVGYRSKYMKCGIIGMTEAFDAHETSTAMALVARGRFHPVAPELLLRDPPSREPTALDYLHWHVAARALREIGRPAEKWREALTDAILRGQRVGPAAACPGAWEAEDRWSGAGGRVYATALNALTLELIVRSRTVFGAGR